MGTKEYNKILKTFDEITDKTKDSKIENISAWVRTSVEKEHKPTMAFVGFNLNHTDQLDMIKKFFGIEIPEEIVQVMDDKPICLILDYSDTPTFLNEQRIVGRKIVVGVPFEILKNYRIAICDEIRSKDEWLELSHETDIACLIVNATMAMNQIERTWLKECAILLFAEDEIIIAITKMEQLNEDEDIKTVRKVVADSFAQQNVSRKVFENMEESLKWMVHFLEDEAIQDKHDKRVVKNGLEAMNDQMKCLIDSAAIDSADIQSALKQLKKQQKTLELARQLAAESVLSNALNSLKVQLCDGIRDYGRQMAANIKKKVEDSPLEQLETMDDKINGYISGSWEYYLKSMSAKADAEIESIALKLTKQMEIDAGKMVSNLDAPVQRIVYSALGLASGVAEGEIFINSRQMSHNRDTLTAVGVGTVTDRLRKEIRNMMLLSIPLFFVNPLASLGNIFVAKAYGKYKTSKELNDIRSEMARQIEKVCFDNAETMIRQLELSFDEKIRTGSLNIKSAYNNLVQQIENSLVELKKSQEEKTALKGYLNHQVTVVFPEFLGSL